MKVEAVSEETFEREAQTTDAATLQRRLQEVLEDNARLWDEVHRLCAERREIQYYEKLADQITSSASWKLTAPLRSGKAISHKVKGKLPRRSS